MKKMFAVCVAFTLARSALGWGAAGHEVIAAEAWRQLSPETKATVITVLKAHPDFSKWQSAYHTNGSFDLFAYVFMRSSTWPDEIVDSDSKYNHPDWHFIDYPLRPPDFPFQPDPKPEDDVLYGISQCEQVLGDVQADPELRAVSLSFLVHLIGDIHQPLHCESFYSDAYPDGDKGGNDFYVTARGKPIKLHALWDGLLGAPANPRTQWYYAIQLEHEHPKDALPELGRDTTPKEWSLESRELAIDKGYLRGRLKGAATKADAPNLPTDYIKDSKTVAERQGALAGYRLADEIQKCLKFDGPISPLPVSNLAAAPRKISAGEAKNHYGEEVVVVGKVAQVTVRTTVAFINMDQRSPDSPLTAVIFPANFDQFGDLQNFNGKSVEITGTVTKYRGKPEIIVDSSNQISVANGN